MVSDALLCDLLKKDAGVPVLSFGIDSPDQVHRAPCESCSESRHHDFVSFLQFVFVFVETQWNRSSRGIAVMLYVDKSFLLGYLYSSTYGLDDAEVGLMRHKPVYILYTQVIALHH